MEDDWEPDEYDLEWMRQLLDMIADGGTWGLPAALSSFTVHHSTKTYDFEGDREHPLVTRSMKVFERLGWRENQ